MLKEFYDYIAKNTLSFFQNRASMMRPGERYCLKLDTEEMVVGVDHALKNITNANNIQGCFEYGEVYTTFTIKLSSQMEVVVVSKIDGMTDDFLATMRNAELTSNHFPILMITHSTIDTITSGTGDLAANGMPFHATSIIEKIKEEIQNAQLSVSDKTLLEYELGRKQSDRFSDKSSLFEYADLLTVLGRGFVKKEDYPSFNLIADPDAAYLVDEKKIIDRLADNHKIFEQIDRVVKHGNITDDLEKDFDGSFISHLVECKKKNIPWYEECTFTQAKASQDKLKKKLDNPLSIDNSGFEVFSSSPLEYSFVADEMFFIQDDGNSKAKKRKKNVLIYNPDHKEHITIEIRTNISIRQSGLEQNGCIITSGAKIIRIDLTPEGCSFAQAKITDSNNKITYVIKICVVDVLPKYLENIQTSYLLKTPQNLKRGKIQIFGVDKVLSINPGQDNVLDARIEQDGVYECRYNQTVNLLVDEDTIDSDTGHIDCNLKIGSIVLPIQIQDEKISPVELTGAGAFKWKFNEQKSLEYRAGKIISGTTEYYTKDAFKSPLYIENEIVSNEWLAVKHTSNGYEEYPLNVTDNIREAYISLLKAYQKKRTLPSLAYYDDELLEMAQSYVSVVELEFSNVQAGVTLNLQQNHTLLLGCVIKTFDEEAISMSPVHPLNIMYQLALLQEEEVGSIRENLIEKLTSLYLIPFIKDMNKNLYQAIEQKYVPEWRFYAPISNKRYQGARNFIQKLVCDKITQYKEHFSFLFEDIGNRQLVINLVNMGDCREIFQGLLRFYAQNLRRGTDPDDLLCFVINIYDEQGMHNEFSLLSDQYKLKEFIKELYGNEEVSDLAMAMTGKIRCFFRNPAEEKYQYSHLTFYEMTSAEDTGASRMDTITTGIALHGLTSGIPSVLNAEWYKTGFGTKYAEKNQLTRMAAYYNAMYRVAFSGSSYEPTSCIFTEIEQGQEGQLAKIYSSSNWVVFVDPKVDLSFFQKKSSSDDELMIIHYSDQYTSASGYDDITVTQKSDQYNEIIRDQLMKKGVTAEAENIDEIISLFNAINGGWMLRLITAKKLTGAADSYFSREKMSILSAIKVCMAYYSHPDIVWIPISLEEMLRVSGGAGLSQKEGLLSAKNLGFEQRPTSDDVLFVGIEGPKEHIKVYIHPVEVKIGQNPQTVLSKANMQVLNTYNGLWNALWPEEGRDILERKLSRNFFIQLLLVCCEKMKLYNIYPEEEWDNVLDEYRENLLNERYEFSDEMDQFIGKGTIVSFGTDVLNTAGSLENDVCLLEFPEKTGSSFMVQSTKTIEQRLEVDLSTLPSRLKNLYTHQSIQIDGEQKTMNVMAPKAIVNIHHDNLIEMSNKTSFMYEEPVARPTSMVAESAVEYGKSSSKPKTIIQFQEVDAQVSEEQSETALGMQITFGCDIATGQSVVWEPNNTASVFHTNTGIIGTMGTGKTQFTKSLITQMYIHQDKNVGGENLGILIFDYKGDYNESKPDFVDAVKPTILKPYQLPFNPLALTNSRTFKPLLPIHTANAFKDTLSKVYGLGPKQQDTLFECIIEAYSMSGISPYDPATWNNEAPTFEQVYQRYANNDEIKKNDSLAAAMNKLHRFQVFENSPSKTKSLFDMLNGVVVIDISNYDEDIQSLIVAITLDLFYSQMQAAGSSKLDGKFRQLTKMILVDEADNFMSEGFNALKRILKEGREFGVGVILSTQSLEHFASVDDYSKYVLTWIVHKVKDLKPKDVDFVFNTDNKGSQSQQLFNDIPKLEAFYSIIKINNEEPRYIKDLPFWELYNDLKSN